MIGMILIEILLWFKYVYSFIIYAFYFMKLIWNTVHILK